MTTTSVHPETIITDVGEAMRTFELCNEVAFDIETTGAVSGDGLRPMRGIVAVVQLAAPGRGTAVLNFGYSGPPPQLVEWLSNRRLIGHNVTTFDVPFMFKYGYDPLAGAGFVDTMVLEQLLLTGLRGGTRTSDGEWRRSGSVSLQNTLHRRLGVNIDKGVDHAGWGREVLTDEQLNYAASDVKHVLRLYEEQTKELVIKGLSRALETEVRAGPVVASMICRGMPLDDTMRSAHLAASRETLVDTDPQLRELLGIGVADVGSHVKIKRAFLDTYGLRLASTDEEHMQRLMGQPGAIGRAAHLVVEARQRKKRFMYNNAWVTEHVTGGRVHPRLAQLGADTGRFTSQDPNMQQVPRDMRSMFGHEDGDRIVKADYAAIEAVVAAVIAGESRLVEWATGERDVHRLVAAEILRKPEADVTKDERTMAKAGTFTLLFGGGSDALIAMSRGYGLEMEEDRANEIIAGFFATFPQVNEYIWNMRRKAKHYREKDLTLTLPIANGMGPIRALRGETLRATRAINTLVQGAAAVGMKRAIGRAPAAGIAKYFRLTVHDELVLEVPKDEADEVADVLVEVMAEGMYDVIGVYPKVEAHVGTHWA